jgi:hypothetical protein
MNKIEIKALVVRRIQNLVNQLHRVRIRHMFYGSSGINETSIKFLSICLASARLNLSCGVVALCQARA